MPNFHFSGTAKVKLALIGLMLWGLLAACGDNTATNQPNTGGQVPPNTAAPLPTNPVAPKPTATAVPLPTSTQTPVINTQPAVTPWPTGVPVPTLKPYPTGQPVAGVPNFGTTENLYGKFTNPDAMQKFLDAYVKGQPGQWEYIVYGIDSVSPARFVYRGNSRQYTLFFDNTKAAYTAPQDQIVLEYTCDGLTKSAIGLELGTCVDNKGEKTSGNSLPAK